MKNNFSGTPGWVLSSHGHPCQADVATEATAPHRRLAASRSRRPSRPAADQLDTYWMQTSSALPEWPETKRLAVG